MKNIFTSIDIGSDNIKVVTCELYNNKLNLLAASSMKSKGVKLGMIVNPQEASLSIRRCLDEVESQLGIQIKKVLATVPSNFAEFEFIKGSVELTNETGIVSGSDIALVMQNAMEEKITPDKEMITIIPINFKVNDEEIVSNPIGMKAHSLQTRAIMATTPKKNVYSVLSVLEDVGVQVIDIMLNGIGDINSLKNMRTDNKIGAIINIGAETMNVALFNKNVIVKNSTIGIGSKEVDKVISSTYKIELQEARKIKEKFAYAHKKKASVDTFYDVTNIYNEDIKINQYDVSELCMNKLEELIDLGVKETRMLSGRDLDYIIFTGGITMMSHFDYLIKNFIGETAEVGQVKIIGVRNNMFSSSVGNIIYFINKLKLKGKNYSMVSSSDMEDLSSRKSGATIASDSMLGKLADYFFGE